MSSSIYPKYVQPRPFQRSHFEKAEKILSTSYYFFDGSKMGLGKTYVPSFISQKFNIPILVVAPVSVAVRWNEVQKEYNLQIKEIISYSSVRSTTGHQPKHGYLSRTDINKKTEFYATDKLKELIKAGCLFVFDECHNLKNKSDQWKACKAICNEVMATNSRSRLMFLSSTFYDKPEHAQQFLETVGIIKSHFMYRHNAGILEYENYGLGELINESKKYDPENTKRIVDEIFKKYRVETAVGTKMKIVVETVCYRLFSEVLIDHIGGIMYAPENRNLQHLASADILNDYLIPDLSNIILNYSHCEDKKNGYYTVSENTKTKLLTSIRGLAEAVEYDEKKQTINPKKFNSATKYLESIEYYKTEIFIRKSQEWLNKNPKNKVVCLLNYLDNIDAVYAGLSKYNPVKITGAVKDRATPIFKFNNDPNCRALIGTKSVNAFGVEYDDKIGDSQRKSFISPDYNVISTHQAAGRTDRENTKSVPIIRFPFPRIEVKGVLVTELKILNAMAKKSNVIKSMNRNKEMLPGDYTNCFSEDEE